MHVGKGKVLNKLYFPGISRTSSLLVSRVSWASQLTLGRSPHSLGFRYGKVSSRSVLEIVVTQTVHLARFLPLKQTCHSVSVENSLIETSYHLGKMNNSSGSSLFVVHKRILTHLHSFLHLTLVGCHCLPSIVLGGRDKAKRNSPLAP